jgi:hypothetical protein
MRVAIILACLALCACDIAGPTDRQSEAAQKAMEHHELRDAIQAPLDKAESAGAPNEQHDKDQAKAIEDAGG